MQVTAAIATWNRCKTLRRTLARMCELRVAPEVDWELIVVNNNCTDNTDAVIESFADRLPIRRVFEARQGLSNARNAAVAAARGELIAITDDDVLVAPHWLQTYVDAATAWPNAAFFGGRIIPEFESTPPAWMTSNLRLFRNMLGMRDLGPEPREFVDEETPFGGNMAFRSWVLERWRFDPELGRSGDGRIMGEEGVLFRQLAAEGLTGVWVPDAELKHCIPDECFTGKYIWNYFHGHGKTFIRVFGPREGKLLGGVPRHQIRKFCTARLKSWLLTPCKAKGWAPAFTTAANTWGKIEESRAIYRRNRRGDNGK
jgi:glycosyltransferase involved in cell wall biosynthesis